MSTKSKGKRSKKVKKTKKTQEDTVEVVEMQTENVTETPAKATPDVGPEIAKEQVDDETGKVEDAEDTEMTDDTNDSVKKEAPLPKGCRVKLHSLKKQDYNGLEGKVVGFDPVTNRLQVKLQASNTIQVRPEKCTKVEAHEGKAPQLAAPDTAQPAPAAAQPAAQDSAKPAAPEPVKPAAKEQPAKEKPKATSNGKSKEPECPFPVGARVVLHSLKQERFNGQVGVVAGVDADSASKRVVVVLSNLQPIKVRPDNVRLAPTKTATRGKPVGREEKAVPAAKTRLPADLFSAYSKMDPLASQARQGANVQSQASNLPEWIFQVRDLPSEPEASEPEATSPNGFAHLFAPPPPPRRDNGHHHHHQHAPPPPSPPSPPRQYVHRAQCCECGVHPILGTRYYRCIACPDANLCERCEAADRHPQQHPLLKMQHLVPSPGRASERVHFGVSCACCGLGSIRGARFVCTVCKDVNLCSTCEHDGKHPSSHPLFKLKTPLEDAARRQAATAARQTEPNAQARRSRAPSESEVRKPASGPFVAIRLPSSQKFQGPLLLPDTLNLAESQRAVPWKLLGADWDRDRALVLGSSDHVLLDDHDPHDRKPTLPTFVFQDKPARNEDEMSESPDQWYTQEAPYRQQPPPRAFQQPPPSFARFQQEQPAYRQHERPAYHHQQERPPYPSEQPTYHQQERPPYARYQQMPTPPPFAYYRHSHQQQPPAPFYPYYGEEYSQHGPARGPPPMHYRQAAEPDYYRSHGDPYAATY
eukprot:g8665.t1